MIYGYFLWDWVGELVDGLYFSQRRVAIFPFGHSCLRPGLLTETGTDVSARMYSPRYSRFQPHSDSPSTNACNANNGFLGFHEGNMADGGR